MIAISADTLIQPRVVNLIGTSTGQHTAHEDVVVISALKTSSAYPAYEVISILTDTLRLRLAVDLVVSAYRSAYAKHNIIDGVAGTLLTSVVDQVVAINADTFGQCCTVLLIDPARYSATAGG